MLTGLDAVARHRLQVAALLPEMAAGAVVSHQSAAVLLGAPIPPGLLDRVHVTRNRRYGGRIKAGLKVHCAPVDRVAELDGRLITSPARTVVDLARTIPFAAAVVAGDALVREFGLTADGLRRELEFARRRRGAEVGRRVVAFLDPRSGGVAHSRARVLLHHLGLPPAAAGGLVCGDGSVLGWVDLYLRGTGVVITLADPTGPPHPVAGASRPAPPPDATLLRRYGFHHIRTTWRELRNGAAASRIRAALAESRQAPPHGDIRPAPLPPATPLPLRPL